MGVEAGKHALEDSLEKLPLGGASMGIGLGR